MLWKMIAPRMYMRADSVDYQIVMNYFAQSEGE